MGRRVSNSDGGGPGGGATQLNELSDVDGTGWVDGDVLTYDAGTLTWTVEPPPAGGSGAPTTADYLVGTAQAGLSAEIVVGTSPGGELGGSWSVPTVDALHGGSTHASVQAAAELTAANALTAHAGAAGAHNASAITSTAFSTIAATNVQAALQEIFAEAGGGATTLNALTDVDTSGVVDGDLLVYNAGLSQWEPGDPSAPTIDTVTGYPEVTEQDLTFPWAVSSTATDETAVRADYCHYNLDGGGVMTTVDRGVALAASGLPGCFWKSLPWATTLTPPIPASGQAWPNPLGNSLYIQFGKPDASIAPAAVGSHTHLAFDFEWTVAIESSRIMCTIMSTHGQWVDRSAAAFTQMFLPVHRDPAPKMGWRTFLIPLGALTQVSAVYFQHIPEAGVTTSSGALSFRVDHFRLAARTKLDTALAQSGAKTVVVPQDHVDTVRQYPMLPSVSKRLVDLRPDHLLIGREDGWQNLREWYLDETGTHDMAKEIEHILGSLAVGARLRMPATARYRCDQMVKMRNLSGVTIDMNGAQLIAGSNEHHRTYPTGGTLGDAVFELYNNVGCRFDNWKLLGHMEVTQWASGHEVMKGTATQTNLIPSTASQNDNPIDNSSNLPSSEWTASAGSNIVAWFEAPAINGFHTFSIRPNADTFTGTMTATLATDRAVSPSTQYNIAAYATRDPQELNSQHNAVFTWWAELIWKDAAHAVISTVEDPQHAIRGPFVGQTMARWHKSSVVATSPVNAAFASVKLYFNVPVNTQRAFVHFSGVSLLPGSSDANASRVLLSGDADLVPQWNDAFQGLDADGNYVFKFKVQNLNDNQPARMAAYILWYDKADLDTEPPCDASTTITDPMTNSPNDVTITFASVVGWPTGHEGCYAMIENELVKVKRAGLSTFFIQRGTEKVGYPTTPIAHNATTPIYRLGHNYATPIFMMNASTYNTPTELEWKVAGLGREHRVPALHIRTFSLTHTSGGDSEPVLYMTTINRPCWYIGHLEAAHGFSIQDRNREINFNDLHVEGMGGDGWYVTALDHHSTRGIHFNRFVSRCSGRQGIAVETGHDITIDNFEVSEAGRSCCDIEPNDVFGRIKNLTMRNGRFFNSVNSAIACTGNADKLTGITIENISAYRCAFGSRNVFLLGAVDGRFANIHSYDAPAVINSDAISRKKEVAISGYNCHYENITATYGMTIGSNEVWQASNDGQTTATLTSPQFFTITSPATSVAIPNLVVTTTDGYNNEGFLTVRGLLGGAPAGAWVSYSGITATEFQNCFYLGIPPPTVWSGTVSFNALADGNYGVYRPIWMNNTVVNDAHVMTPCAGEDDCLAVVVPLPIYRIDSESMLVQNFRFRDVNTGAWVILDQVAP